jgi:hypothetical protein
VAQARAQLSGASFVTTKEDVAVAAAYYAQLPCNWRFRPRLANLSSLNFLGLSPLHNFATGKPNFNPWGPSVKRTQILVAGGLNVRQRPIFVVNRLFYQRRILVVPLCLRCGR